LQTKEPSMSTTITRSVVTYPATKDDDTHAYTHTHSPARSQVHSNAVQPEVQRSHVQSDTHASEGLLRSTHSLLEMENLVKVSDCAYFSDTL
jgi:hypothetical protein